MAQFGFFGAGGQRFGSSVLARASTSAGMRGRRGGLSGLPSERTASRNLLGAPTINFATQAPSGLNEEALAAIQRAKAFYQPGGGFGRGIETGLERGRVKAVSGGMQNLVSAGLAGTTMAGGLGKKFEEEVAMPTRAGVEEQRGQAISGIEMQEASMRFQASQAGLQRGFQAGQAGAQRTLQQYIADLQADLQRESMAFRSQPTITQQAQQFPSIYNQQGQFGDEPPTWASA